MDTPNSECIKSLLNLLGYQDEDQIYVYVDINSYLPHTLVDVESSIRSGTLSNGEYSYLVINKP